MEKRISDEQEKVAEQPEEKPAPSAPGIELTALSFAKVLSGVNAFEISNLQEQETESRYMGRKTVDWSFCGPQAHAVAGSLFCASSLVAQQPQPQYFTPMPSVGQMLAGRAAANDGSVGVVANKSPDGFTVATVPPGSPADKATIKQGDVIKKVNGKAASDLSQMDFYNEVKKKPGESVQFVVVRAEQESSLAVTAELRSKVYPQDAKLPPAIGQLILDGHATIGAALAQDNPQRVILYLQASNLDVPNFSLDDAKFFVLDGQRQQLHHVTLDEIRYTIQTTVAQNMRSGSVPPPPPPAQRQYTITGSENGNYTLNNLGGGMATMSGTSSSTYTVTPQPDFGQLGYSLGLAIRQRRDRKHDEQLAQQAQQILNQWNTMYLKADSSIIPGENRMGGIVYWSQQGAKGPFRVVLFVTDPNTKKEQSVTFDFQ